MSQATGGSGHYICTCEQSEEVVGVSIIGVVIAVSLGAAVITLSDAKNADRFDQAVVSSSTATTYAYQKLKIQKFFRL